MEDSHAPGQHTEEPEPLHGRPHDQQNVTQSEGQGQIPDNVNEILSYQAGQISDLMRTIEELQNKAKDRSQDRSSVAYFVSKFGANFPKFDAYAAETTTNYFDSYWD